jgi:hypothetical protein
MFNEDVAKWEIIVLDNEHFFIIGKRCMLSGLFNTLYIVIHIRGYKTSGSVSRSL